MTIDGHEVEPLPNGSCYVTTDGVKTYHPDQGAAVRHIERMAGERMRYEAQRVVEGGKR